MVNYNCEVKVLDFAFAVKQASRKHKIACNCGTLHYMAPEILQKSISQPQPLDVWAIGVLLVKMRTGRFPFYQKDCSSVSEQKTKMLAAMKKNEINPKCLVYMSDKLKDLVSQIFRFDSQRRPTVKDILAHDFFKTQ